MVHLFWGIDLVHSEVAVPVPVEREKVHERAVEAELSFLRRHLLGRSRTGRAGEVTADSARH